MKNLFNYLPLIFFSITSLSLNAQSQSAAVLSVYTQSAKISPEMAESVLRVEMTKTEQFNVIDKLDMIENDLNNKDATKDKIILNDKFFEFKLATVLRDRVENEIPISKSNSDCIKFKQLVNHSQSLEMDEPK